MKSSKNLLIRNESELLDRFEELVPEDQDIRWDRQASTLTLHFDSRSFQFRAYYSLKPSLPELESLVCENNEWPPILVTPYLSPRILDFCRKHRLAALDLNGRAYIREEGILIDRKKRPGPEFRFELEPRNVFVGKSERIIRSLLTDRDRIWSQAELVRRSRASSGLVSRIFRHLVSQGFIRKESPRKFTLKDPLGLIEEWARADDLHRRTQASRFTTFGGDPLKVAHQLARWAEAQSVDIAFTQWTAAWLRHAYTEPQVTSAYVSRLPELTTVENLGLRPVEEAGRVWLFVPADEGVFLETRKANGLELVSDAQIFLDLQRAGLRGDEQANALREWKGFCRP